jgi:hypothetical protein
MVKTEARCKKIAVVVKDDLRAEEKFKTLFGARNVTIHQYGLGTFVARGLSKFLAKDRSPPAGRASMLPGR